jgi:hypothetical protein
VPSYVSRAVRPFTKWVASNLLWSLVVAASGAVVSAVLKAASVLDNPYGLVAVALFVAALLVAAGKAWRRHTTKPPEQAGLDTKKLRELLRDLLRYGIRLRERGLVAPLARLGRNDVVVGQYGGVDDSDAICRWAKETWELLDQLDPVVALVFYGPTPPYGPDRFEMVHTIEVRKDGCRVYLDKRISILTDVLSEPAQPVS